MTLEINQLFGGIYKNKKVLITGHTGFKGSWLALWLKKMGAHVMGFSLAPSTEPNHFNALNLEIKSVIGDIRDDTLLHTTLKEYKPEIVFHLAAQPLVRESYKDPVETFEINVIGTLNVYQACKMADSVRAIVSITTDKVYKNNEWHWGYRENDPFGGYDPYSASKACAEILSDSFRNSYFNVERFGSDHNTLLCTTRAGNVIGGGDWANDRLIPDIIKAASKNEKVIIRSPSATRPWQHVLEPLSAYLQLGEKLLRGYKEYAEGWNIGPRDDDVLSVAEILDQIKQYWSQVKFDIQLDNNAPHEANQLKLDFSKARNKLNWRPVWNIQQAIQKTILWYRKYYLNHTVNSLDDLHQYVSDASVLKISWTQ